MCGCGVQSCECGEVRVALRCVVRAPVWLPVISNFHDSMHSEFFLQYLQLDIFCKSVDLFKENSLIVGGFFHYTDIVIRLD